MTNRLNIFIREPSTLVMIELLETGGTTNTTIHKKHNITYSYIHEVVDILKEFDLVTTKKHGREKTITLTALGVELAQSLREVYEKTKEFKWG